MAEKSGLPPPTAPQVDQAAMQQAQPPQQPPQAGGYPELPPSYEEAQGGPKQQQPPYPTQQPGYQAPPPQQQQAPVIVQYVNAPNFGPNPVNMTCPHCQAQIRTSIDSEPGPMAWILAGVLCVVGLWPCACIPCCIDSLNSVTHKCPQCKNFLGRYKGGM